MAVTQIAFDILPEIQAGIDVGVLLRFGGVVRDRAGHIVKHLEEVSIPEESSSAGVIHAVVKKSLRSAGNKKRNEQSA